MAALLSIASISPAFSKDNTQQKANDSTETVTVQAAAFSQVKNAIAFEQKIHQTLANTPTFIDKTPHWHKVMIGPVASNQKKQIEASLKDLLKAPQKKENHQSSILLSELPKLSLPQPLKSQPTPSQAQTATVPNANKSETKSIRTNLANKASPKKRQYSRLWNLRQADIKSVIAEVSRETGKNFIIDPRVQGKISIISQTAISSKELYAVFLSMLQVAGFSAIDTGTVVKVVPNIEAKALSGNDNQMASGDEMVVQVVPIHHVSSEQLVPVIRPLMPQWSNVSAYGPSNMLILAGRADNIKRLADIIHQVDSAGANGIDVVPLEYALAMDVVNTIKSLLDNQKTSPNNRQATIAADDKANTVIISGSKTERLKLRILISQLDNNEQSAGTDNTKVVYLHFLRAEDLAPILAGIAKANFSGEVGTTIGALTSPTLDTTAPVGNNTSDQNQTTDSASSSQSTSSASQVSANTQASSTSTEGSAKPKVQIIAEPNTNSIIISGPNAVTRTLRQVISRLDIRPAQILIEALIAEINEDDVNQLGLDWGMVVSGDEGSQAFRRGFAIIDSNTRLSDFQAQLYALINNQKANILSTPSVVVLDNRQAKILVGQQVSVQDSTYPNNANGAGTATPYSTFTRQDVALHLYVRPQISQGKTIQLQIDQGNDTLANPLDVATARPVINTSSINTSVLVNSGDILVLGGLTQNGLQTQDYKIPILSSIPGIGRAFQNNSKTHNKKVLMVFIRPIIMNNVSSGLQVTGSKYQDIQKHQLNWISQQEYNPQNNNIVLKNLQSLDLPKPFSQVKAHGK